MAIFEITISGKSLINKKKKVGPRKEPCGTPALLTDSGDESLTTMKEETN